MDEVSFETMPSLTYAMHLELNSISGKTDDLEAIKQAVYKILRTERYTYPVYSWDYGIELMDLFGMPTPYVEIELKRRIKEALEWDDRIDSVDDFVFSYPQDKNTVQVSFTVHTSLGDIESDYTFSKIEGDTETTPIFYMDGETGVFTWKADVDVVGHSLILKNPTQYRIEGDTLIFGE